MNQSLAAMATRHPVGFAGLGCTACQQKGLGDLTSPTFDWRDAAMRYGAVFVGGLVAGYMLAKKKW